MREKEDGKEDERPVVRKEIGLFGLELEMERLISCRRRALRCPERPLLKDRPLRRDAELAKVAECAECL